MHLVIYNRTVFIYDHQTFGLISWRFVRVIWHYPSAYWVLAFDLMFSRLVIYAILVIRVLTQRPLQNWISAVYDKCHCMHSPHSWTNMTLYWNQVSSLKLSRYNNIGDRENFYKFAFFQINIPSILVIWEWLSSDCSEGSKLNIKSMYRIRIFTVETYNIMQDNTEELHNFYIRNKIKQFDVLCICLYRDNPVHSLILASTRLSLKR